MRPSFIASGVSGTIIIIALFIFLISLGELISDSYKLIMTLTLIGIGIQLHGIAHYHEEIYYDFNPFIGKWDVKDNPKVQTYTFIR
jgi:hypothetical protein